MKFDTAQTFIKNIILKEIHIPVMFVGASGVGKSWMCRGAIDTVNEEYYVGKKEFKFIDLRLATQEVGDLVGLPRIIDGVTTWTKPEWWPKPNTRGLLFLDEMNRAPVDVRQAIFQLVSEWRMHTHVLPEGWVIASAINPDNGEFQVETMDIAMLRRFCQIKFIPSAIDWMRWADNNGLDKRIIKFIRENKKFLYKEEQFDVTAIPSPEGYRMVDELLAEQVVPADAAGENCRMEVIAGLVGIEAAAELTQYLIRDVENCVQMSEILNNYNAVKKEAIKQSHDRMSKTIDEFVVKYGKQGSPNKKQLKNMTQFVKELTAEWKMVMLVGVRDNKQLIHKLGEDIELRRQMVSIYKQAKEEEGI